VRFTLDELTEDVTQDELEVAIQRANDSSQIHGILVFQPLPAHLDVKRVNALIHPTKDVDGLSPTNQALVYQGSPYGIPPCTAAGVVAVLKHYNVPLSGARVTIIGRSLVVAKPLSMLLLGENATVTICHSQTKFLMERTREADVVVAAIGRRKLLGSEYFVPGQTVVDVGIHVDDDGSLVGDVDLEAVDSIVEAITPVRGGVGSVTTTVMLEHVVTAAERLSELNVTGEHHA
jgi:methylenetetrahydrofolate dehydrogenase (NADP+)/methenyltetrahydrofolate cyclohydrolase